MATGQGTKVITGKPEEPWPALEQRDLGGSVAASTVGTSPSSSGGCREVPACASARFGYPKGKNRSTAPARRLGLLPHQLMHLQKPIAQVNPCG
jgi:hypothetical protein